MPTDPPLYLLPTGTRRWALTWAVIAGLLWIACALHAGGLIP